VAAYPKTLTGMAVCKQETAQKDSSPFGSYQLHRGSRPPDRPLRVRQSVWRAGTARISTRHAWSVSSVRRCGFLRRIAPAPPTSYDHAPRHPADGSINRAAANRFDRDADRGLLGPVAHSGFRHPWVRARLFSEYFVSPARRSQLGAAGWPAPGQITNRTIETVVPDLRREMRAHEGFWRSPETSRR
jgi:hypothetical protein